MNAYLVVFAAIVACATAGGYLGHGYGLGYGGGLGYGHGYGYGHGAVLAAPVYGHRALGHSSRYEVRGHGGIVGFAARPVALGHGYGLGYGHGYGHGGYGLGLGYGHGYGHSHGYGYHG